MSVPQNPVYCIRCREAIDASAAFCNFCGSPQNPAQGSPLYFPPSQAHALPDHYFRILLASLVFGIFVTVGAISPWVQILGLQINGTDIGPIRWGFFVFAAGLATLAVTGVGYTKRSWEVLGMLPSFGVLLLAVPTACLGYYLWFCRPDVFDYGLYLIAAGALGFISLRYFMPTMQDMRLLTIGSVFCLVAVFLACLSGFRSPMRNQPRPGRDLASVPFLDALRAGTAFPGGPNSNSSSSQAEPGRWKFDVVSWSESYELPHATFMGGKPASGNKFILAVVRVENVSREEQYALGPIFEMEGSDRHIYSPSILPVTDNLLNAQLLPGGKAEGTVVFEVPSSVSPARLRLSRGP